MQAPAVSRLPPRWTKLEPHAKQRAYYECRARFVVVEAGRRSGKTEACKRRKVRRMLRHALGVPGYRCLLGAPTQAQAEAIWWDDILNLIPRWAFGDAWRSRGEIHLRAPYDAHFKVAGLDEARRFEGVPVDDAGIDEIADCDPGIWDKTLSPLLDTKGRPGSIDFIGVPRPSALLQRLSEMARGLDPLVGKSPDWAYFHWTSAELLSPQAIADARARMGQREFAQEYEASRVSMAGRVCYNFDSSVHLHDGLHYNPQGPLIFCLDFNVEPGPACVGQDHVVNGEQYTDWLGEVHIPIDSRTELVCKKLIADWGKHEGPVYVEGDPAGGARTTAGGGESNWQTARDILSRHFGSRVRFMYERSAPRIIERINAWNARLRSADGRVHMRFERRKTRQLVLDCENVQWKQGADYELEKKDLKRTHWLDAASYRIARVFPIASRGGLLVETY